MSTIKQIVCCFFAPHRFSSVNSSIDLFLLKLPICLENDTLAPECFTFLSTQHLANDAKEKCNQNYLNSIKDRQQ